MKASAITLFHGISCLQFAFAVYYDHTYTVIPRTVIKTQTDFGGKFKYLTFWDAIVQTLFFLICLLNDFLGSNAVTPKKSPFIRQVKDFFHAAFSFPVAMFVGVTFWSLMFIDRELVMPKAMDPYFPWWLNHLMHTMIMVSTTIEILIAPRQYPKKSYALTSLLGFTLIYIAWIHVIHSKSGVWVYPILNVLSLPLRVIFMSLLCVLMIIMYTGGEALNNLVWGSDVISGAGKKKKSK